MKRKSKEKRKPTDTDTDDQVFELVREQIPSAMERAMMDQRRLSATWVATGNSLALLVCDATSLKTTTKIYRCRVLDVLVEPV